MQDDSLIRYSLTAKASFQFGEPKIVLEEYSWDAIDGSDKTVLFLTRHTAEQLIADLKREIKICKSFEKWQTKNCTKVV